MNAKRTGTLLAAAGITAAALTVTACASPGPKPAASGLQCMLNRDAAGYYRSVSVWAASVKPVGTYIRDVNVVAAGKPMWVHVRQRSTQDGFGPVSAPVTVPPGTPADCVVVGWD